MNHAVSTYLVVGVLLAGLGACAGFVIGVQQGPSYHDAMRVEQRLREVFCEQAIKNSLMQTCEVLR